MYGWVEIEEFPGYSVSSLGEIRNDLHQRPMVLMRNQQGIIMVGLFKDGRQYKRSVDLIVAKAFLGVPHNPAFDTVIHLDGDLTNNQDTNLMWRPRWYRLRYHRQFRENRFSRWSSPIELMETGEIFENPTEAAMTHGILEADIHQSVVDGSEVWPQGYHFEFASK